MSKRKHKAACGTQKHVLQIFRDQMMAGKRPDEVVALNPSLLHPVYWKYRKGLWVVYSRLRLQEPV
jgi:hypothetical protein